jgi:hypothetical protein
MAMRLSALRAGRPLPPGRFLVLISVRNSVDLRAIVRLEGLGQLKNSMTSSVMEPAIFRLVAWCRKQLRYRVPLKDLNPFTIVSRIPIITMIEEYLKIVPVHKIFVYMLHALQNI